MRRQGQANRPPCRMCGRWLCLECGWIRAYANRFSGLPQVCGGCGSRNGQMQAVVHRRVDKARDHEEEYMLRVERGIKPRYVLED